MGLQSAVLWKQHVSLSVLPVSPAAPRRGREVCVFAPQLQPMQPGLQELSRLAEGVGSTPLGGREEDPINTQL